MSKIPRKPASPPAASPNDPRYFDARDLEAELKRTFQICHECRMCVNYCGSFPELFRRVDRDIESGKAEGAECLHDQDFTAIGEECWQCKLCYIKCPYTADDGASELLDFPRLMARETAVRARRNGVALVDQILGEPQLVGMMGSGVASAGANLINANRLVRKIQEKVAGISSEFPLPPLARETFSSWQAKHPAPEKTTSDVVLFATCYGEYNAPHVPAAAVRVLEHNGIRVLPPGVLPDSDEGARAATCCGMPNLDGGDVTAFVAKVRSNVELLYPQVRAGLKIVVPSPTCAYTMKKEWPVYLETPEARAVAEATLDLMEYVVVLGKEKRLKLDFEKSLGNVAYHAACHLRAQKIGFPGARVLGKVPDTEVRIVEECSAVDGTWGMKAAHYETGRKYARKLVRGVEDAEPDMVVTDCTLSALRVAYETEKNGKGPRVVHPIEALAEAYGLGEAVSTRGIVPGGARPSGE